MRRDLSVLSLLIMLRLVLPGDPAWAAPKVLEDLHYQLVILVWPDAATIRVTLKDQGRGRLMAEVLGETQGFIKLISGNHKAGNYQAPVDLSGFSSGIYLVRLIYENGSVCRKLIISD